MKKESSEKNLVVNNLVGKLEKYIRKQQSKKELVGRLVYYKILCTVAEIYDLELPFEFKLNNEINIENNINRDYIKKIILSLADILAEDMGLLDDIYSRLVPKDYRRKYGQFYTPKKVAEFMVKWGISNGYATSVLDPAVGTGIFLSSVITVLKNQENIWLTGIDIDPLLLDACYVRLKLMGIDDNRVNLIKHDFLTWRSRNLYDFIVCNPPYIKFHGFNRDIIAKIAKEHCLELTNLTNLYALFFIQATRFVKSGGLLAFITPSEFLYTGYGETLKKFLLQNYRIHAFVLVGLEKDVFNGVITTALITLLEKDVPDKSHRVKFVSLQNSENLSFENAEVIKEVPQHELDPKAKWLIYFAENSFKEFLSELVPLSTIATVDRGIATGYNEFFTLSENDVRKYSIPKEFLRPVVLKAQHCPHYDFTKEDWEKLKKKGEKVYLLYCFTENPPKPLKKYLDYGIKIGVNKRYIPSHRKLWYAVDKREPAPILALVFSRERMRFIFNKAKVLNLTAFHCVYPSFSDEKKIKALLAYLNSDICKEIATYWGRVYGTGLRKLEPKDLENLPILDVTKLKQEDIKRLSELFDKLCKISRLNQKKEKDIKREINETIEKILLKQHKSQRQQLLDEFIS